MKKIFILLFLNFSVIISEDKQSELPKLGIYIAYVVTGISSDSISTDSKNIIAPGFGLSTGLWMGRLPTQVGIGINPRGWIIEKKVGTSVTVITTNAQYVDLWARVPFIIGPFYFSTGLNAGTFISGKKRIEISDTAIPDLKNIAKKDLDIDAFGLDYGVNLGIGYQMNKAQIGALYFLGVSEQKNGVKFNSLIFNLGYSF